LEQAMNGMERLNNCWNDLHFAGRHLEISEGDELEFTQKISEFWDKYCEALDDDFNTATAIGTVFEAVRMINTRLRGGKISKIIFDSALKFFSDINDVMGIFNVDASERKDIEKAIDIFDTSKNIAVITAGLAVHMQDGEHDRFLNAVTRTLKKLGGHFISTDYIPYELEKESKLKHIDSFHIKDIVHELKTPNAQKIIAGKTIFTDTATSRYSL